MDPATAMTVFATAKDSAELLIFIIDTVRKVQRLRKECEQLGSLADFLQSILKDHANALKDVKTEQKLRSQLSEVAVFVVTCTKKSSLLQRVWEVTWEKRLPRMIGNLKDWILYFIMEASAKSMSKQDILIEGQRRILEDINLVGKIDSSVDEMKSGVEEGLKKQEASIQNIRQEMQMIASMKAAPWRIDFPPGDARLDVSKNASGNYSGHLNGEAVVCISISSSTRDSRVGPRHVILYSRLSANTLVHPFYGLADRDGALFAVMKDMRGAKVMANSLTATIFDDDLDRMRIIYDLAQTIAYLHSVDIIVRSLSDNRVLLFDDQGRWKPIITDLDKARLLLEDTVDSEADARYESLEYSRTRRHNVSTDVWSFGVLLWEWIFRKPPFEKSAPVFEAVDRTGVESIRRMLNEGKYPWKLDSSVPKNAPLSHVKVLVENCCHPKPTLRPPMASVAQSLFMILSCGDILELPTNQDTEEAKVRVRDALDASEAGTRDEKSNDMILPEDHNILQGLVNQGDPVASALLGAAIWRGMVEHQQASAYLLVGRNEEEQATEERARAALPLLDFAAQAGVKTAYTDLRKVHRALEKLYHELRR